MKSNPQIWLKHASNWAESNDVQTRGTAFLEDRLLEDREINQYIGLAGNFDDFVGRVKSLNGFFAIIVGTGNRLMFAVDLIRSLPLFYAIHGEQAYLSDDAHWIREQLGMPEFDPISREEFSLTGFVVGPHTLCAEINQVQAGEAVSLKRNGRGWAVRPVKYRQFRAHDFYEGDEEGLLKTYDEVLISSFERTLRVVDGRQVVVPLSGGYDSRLVVLMLKKMGYTNVLTFGFGEASNPETVIGAQVAGALGYPWHQILYNKEKWHSWIRTKEWDSYFRSADNLSSLPVLQDWPANRELKESGLVSPDAVFIAGHAADPLAGSRVTLTPIVLQEEFPSEEQFVLSILESHYVLRPWPADAQTMLGRYGPRILESIGGMNTYHNWASAFDGFNENERQAKFIVNILRATEWWGYSWWMPFFDGDYFSFWERVPLKFRLGERLHLHYADRLYKKLTEQEPRRLPDRQYNLNPQVPSQEQPNFWKTIAYKVWRGPLLRPLRRARIIRSGKKLYSSDQAGWLGIVDEKTFIHYYLRGKHDINSLLIANYLGELFYDGRR